MEAPEVATDRSRERGEGPQGTLCEAPSFTNSMGRHGFVAFQDFDQDGNSIPIEPSHPSLLSYLRGRLAFGPRSAAGVALQAKVVRARSTAPSFQVQLFVESDTPLTRDQHAEVDAFSSLSSGRSTIGRSTGNDDL